MDEDEDIIDRMALRALRAETGTGFPRILDYFREDGLKSVDAIEAAMRRRDAAALVIPAHTLKGDALQFGALPLGRLAERIEQGARLCVETRTAPDQLTPDALAVRPLLERTLARLSPPQVAMPAMPARPAFARRMFGTAVR